MRCKRIALSLPHRIIYCFSFFFPIFIFYYFPLSLFFTLLSLNLIENSVLKLVFSRTLPALFRFWFSLNLCFFSYLSLIWVFPLSHLHLSSFVLLSSNVFHCFSTPSEIIEISPFLSYCLSQSFSFCSILFCSLFSFVCFPRRYLSLHNVYLCGGGSAVILCAVVFLQSLPSEDADVERFDFFGQNIKVDEKTKKTLIILLDKVEERRAKRRKFDEN